MNELFQRVDQALDGIRPYLQADGGNVQLLEVTSDMVVRLKLLGSCENCSMSMMTMKAGIEKTIQKAIPEIVRVEAVSDLQPTV
ncbi:MAG: NifU family protein [Sphingobacteriaceae bacterium]|nr:NifU family protein [Sphingobacteriaceae bacterium]